MFRKITSKRDPDISFWDALGTEFGAYFERVGACLGGFCARRPQTIFWTMVSLLALSAALSFTYFRKPATAPAALAAQKQPAGQGSNGLIGDSFARILGTGAALQQTLSLKQRLENLLAKKQLSGADSIALEKALDSLQVLQHQLHKP